MPISVIKKDKEDKMKRIILKLKYGFGNQLYQYACAYAMAKRENRKLYMDLSFYDGTGLQNHEVYLLDQLKIAATPVFRSSGLQKSDNIVLKRIAKVENYIRRGGKCAYYSVWSPQKYRKIDLSNEKRNVYLEGWFQSYKYFEDYQDDIRNMYQPSFPITEKMQEWMKKIASTENSTSLHIRRGDYITDYGSAIGMNYYRRAMEYIQSYNSNTHFFIFSDDIEWAKENIKQQNIHFVSDGSMNMLEEFFVMSSCKNQIISNSSFSWWAAWLNTNKNKIVVAPCIEKSKAGDWKKESYPMDWYTIDTTM